MDEAFDWVVEHLPDLVAATLTARRRAAHPRLPARVLPAPGRDRQRLERAPAGRRRSSAAPRPSTTSSAGRPRPARSTSPSRCTPWSRPSSRTCGRSARSATPPGPSPDDPIAPVNAERVPARLRICYKIRTGERRWSSRCTINLGPWRCAAARPSAIRLDHLAESNRRTVAALLAGTGPSGVKHGESDTVESSGDAQASPDSRSSGAASFCVREHDRRVRAQPLRGRQAQRRSSTTSISPTPIPRSRRRSRSCSRRSVRRVRARHAGRGAQPRLPAAPVDPARRGRGRRRDVARACVRAIDVHVHPSTPGVRRRRARRVRARVRGVLPHDAAAPRRRRDGRVFRAADVLGVLFAWDAETNTGLPPVTNDFVAGVRPRPSRRVRRLRVGRPAARATPRSPSSSGRCASSACAG